MLFRSLLFSFSLALVAGSVLAQGLAPKVILIMGDSLTAGYGLEDPAAEAYPALLQQKLDARPPSASHWRVINAGLSGDTTSGGLHRIDWVLRQPVDVFMLELGGNDGLRGLPLDLVRSNLLAIVTKVRVKNPSVQVVLAGMRMPTNLGDYAEGFERLFPELARAQNWTLIPFILQRVGGVAALNQVDGIHPTAEGHKLIAETVWPFLAPSR